MLPVRIADWQGDDNGVSVTSAIHLQRSENQKQWNKRRALSDWVGGGGTEQNAVRSILHIVVFSIINRLIIVAMIQKVDVFLV